jgi:hypothetical protein
MMPRSLAAALTIMLAVLPPARNGAALPSAIYDTDF